MEKRKKLGIRIGIFFLAAVLLIGSGITAGAYLYGSYQFFGSPTIKIDLLFDQLDPEGLAAYLEEFEQTYGRKPDAAEKEWGHIGNPYVISDIRHLQNLSILQNAGFFQNIFRQLGPEGQQPYAPGDLPCFLVSTRQYGPAVIDGSNTAISSIGTEEHPFIGFLQGTGGGDLENGETYPTSTIRNVTVLSDSDDIDVGFFGKISCLGEPDREGEGSFAGVPSRLSNLIFSDLTVRVTRQPDSLWTLLEHIFFRYLTAEEASAIPDPDETHHLGLIAGHVEYSSASNLSVYYSSPDFCAISLLDDRTTEGGKPTNYLSGCGFFGLMDHLDPETSEVGQIVIHSGKQNTDPAFSGGLSGGNGQSSGLEPGRIQADVFYALCHKETEDQPIELRNLPQISSTTIEGYSTKYYFYDGVFTFALSGSQVDPDTLDLLWPQDGRRKPLIKVYALIPMDVTEPPEAPETEAPETEVPETEDGSAEAATEPDTEPTAEPSAAPSLQRVTFLKHPEDLTLKLWTAEGEVRHLLEPEADGTYLLEPGDYFYSADREGYLSVAQDVLTVEAGVSEISVTLEKLSAENPGTQTDPEQSSSMPTDSVLDIIFPGLRPQVPTHGAEDSVPAVTEVTAVPSGEAESTAVPTVEAETESAALPSSEAESTAVPTVETEPTEAATEDLPRVLILQPVIITDWNPELPPMETLPAPENPQGSTDLVLARPEKWHVEARAEHVQYSAILQAVDSKDQLNQILAENPNAAFVISFAGSDHQCLNLGTQALEDTTLWPYNSYPLRAYGEGNQVAAVYADVYARRKDFLGMALQLQHAGGSQYYIQQNKCYLQLPESSWNQLTVSRTPAPVNLDYRQGSWVFLSSRKNMALQLESGKFGAGRYYSGSSSVRPGQKFNLYQVFQFETHSELAYQWTAGDGDQDPEVIRLDSRAYVLKPEMDILQRGKPHYTLEPLDSLGWNLKSQGMEAFPHTPMHFFNIKQAANWSFSGQSDDKLIGAQDVILVPMGADREQLPMPTGTVAFKMNEANQNSYIRTILRLPTSGRLYDPGEFDQNSALPDGVKFGPYRNSYYNPGSSSGASQGMFFEKSNFQYHYALVPIVQPRVDSYRYHTMTEEARLAYEQEQKEPASVKISYQGQEYITFLEQGTYMMAAEFKPTEAGVYYVAITDGHPLQLIYCEASGIATEGDDGSKGSPLDRIDFVYANSRNQVIPVTLGAPAGQQKRTPQEYWYPSKILLQFDNWKQQDGENPRIHEVLAKLYRSILDDGVKTGMEARLSGGNQEQLVLTECGRNADPVTVSREDQIG